MATMNETTPEAPAAPPPDARLAELSREAAAYRNQRNDALRRAHAYATMLRAHNIDTAPVTDEALAALPIAQGAVDGPFAYTAPEPTVPAAPAAPAPEGPQPLTRDAIRAMSAEQINDRWTDITAMLKNGG